LDNNLTTPAVRRNRIERTPLAPVITPTDPRLVIVGPDYSNSGGQHPSPRVISTRNVNLS